MFVDHDGQTTEIDDYSDLGEFTEQDGGGETADGGVVAPIKEKARGTGKKKVVRSMGQGGQGTPAWVKIGLEYEVWRDRVARGTCMDCGNYGQTSRTCRGKKITTKVASPTVHAMNRIFHDYLDKFIVVYLDDILIFSRTVEEHDEHLKTVLGLLRQHQYKVNLDKCEFGRTKILYLGHEISADGLRPEDAKVASIRDWPRPQTVTEVRSFLGMTGYYRPFVKNYSTIASPLTDLTRLDTPWEWTEECEASFKKLKYDLTHYEVLKLLDPDKPFVVTTDTSQYGIGAVLAQQEGPKLRPIEYMSKKMPSQKLAKSTYERELYALYRALITPACNLPLKCLRRGGKIAIINLQETPKDRSAVLVLRAFTDQVMAGVMQELRRSIPPFVRIDRFCIKCISRAAGDEQEDLCSWIAVKSCSNAVQCPRMGNLDPIFISQGGDLVEVYFTQFTV
ncbi:hypothetical protein CBR_g41560 [Chara braunii]|uniref:Reverse transcriptase domain-containing protein n=1 Tax=Chara braunii TaxID=69332 RepID=A0A388K2T2_CHABU|nr:hypothetical protein CBR_g41560 [Chara braunii]|eukprot:GBG64360.1 hypothetical protein CBR_g41560 [Chara braunii]